jgi:hypothetical protein
MSWGAAEAEVNAEEKCMKCKVLGEGNNCELLCVCVCARACVCGDYVIPW